MLKLLKLLSNQHLKNKLNLDNSVINLLYRTLIYLLQDTLLKNILTNDYQRNKLTITNFHCLILVYISIGYIFCKDNDNIKEKELKDILKELIRQSQSKEKNHFKKCHVCIEINKIIDTNNLIISINESMSSYKNAIRINNNCLSAQRLMEECHLITKVKGQNEILSLQHYILNANKQQKNNSISINKKNNFNDTYDMLKTSFSSISESLINQKILKTTENNELKYKVNKKKKYDFNKSISIQSLSNTIERLENNNMKILDYKKVNSRNEKENFSPPPLPKIKIDNNKINNYINNIQTGILKLENDFNNFKTFTENTKKQIKLYTFLEFPKKNK